MLITETFQIICISFHVASTFLISFIVAFIKLCPDFLLYYCKLISDAYVLKCVVRLGVQTEGVQYHPPNSPWPSTEIMKKIPFEYTIHDAKYDDISTIYCPGFKPRTDG